MKTFEELGLSEKVLKTIEGIGYEEPTRIQEEVIPVLLEGKDVIAQAQTGTGKTAAFGMPLIDLLKEEDGLQALILLPTRELAIQVAGEMRKFAKFKRLKEVAIYGGQPIDRQIRTLKMGVNIVVGTPGRILDHLNRRTLNLSKIKYVILDEADEMLDMGFIEDIESILKGVNEDRQTMLFSATMPAQIKAIAKKHMKSPVNISVMPKEVTVSTVKQYYLNVTEGNKLDTFTKILDASDIQSGLVFCRTKKSVDELVESLQALGYSVEGIHGDYNQTHRLNAISKFKDGVIDFLIATDVAARGLDIENISHVFNYHIPENAEAYVHRIGRTGRAGRTGVAITLVQPREFKLLKMIEQYTKSKMVPMAMPKIKDVYESRVNKFKKLITDTISEGKFGEYSVIVEQLAEENDVMEVCAAALKLVFEKEFKVGLNDLKEMKEEAHTNQSYRLFLNVGREHNVTKKDIIKLLTSVKGIAGNDIFDIDTFNGFTFVNVNEEAGRKLINTKLNVKINGKKVNIALAKNK
ncbi:MAG: ATP-dependent helicase [Clostridiales bacterium]|jgi:ATP-dependent RNA helicase DeaD|nr:ATP-dependent helicase [Clostridiales bacterium]